MWSFFLLFSLHIIFFCIMFAAVYPYCCKTKLHILWSMIYCERLFKQSVISKCVTCSSYQAAFCISILALNTRSSIHVFGCKQTTCQAPGYLTQDFNETHISWWPEAGRMPGNAKGYCWSQELRRRGWDLVLVTCCPCPRRAQIHERDMPLMAYHGIIFA